MSKITLTARELSSMIMDYEMKIYELKEKLESFQAIRESDLEAMYQEELEKRKNSYYTGNGTNDI